MQPVALLRNVVHRSIASMLYRREQLLPVLIFLGSLTLVAGAEAAVARSGVFGRIQAGVACRWQVQKELGLAFHPIEETYADMAATLIQKGILKPKPVAVPK